MTLYKIKYGLGGGFGGAKDFEILDLGTLEEAQSAAYEMAVEFASMFEGSCGLPDFYEIKEEEACSDEEANEIYYEELENWLDYSVEEYHEEDK